jgi:hypothetical protein
MNPLHRIPGLPHGRNLIPGLVPGSPASPLRWIDEWSVASQQRARRNAMIASTALAQRRAELDDVEEFLAGLDAPSLIAGQVAAHG